MRQLSATTLKLFSDCPRCFWMHVNKRIQRPRGPFPSLPSGIDRILKEYFDTYRQSGTLPPLIRDKMEGRLGTSALTIGFNDVPTKTRLWGKLDDCVMLADNCLAPLDHKTRASAPDSISYSEKYYKLQMDVYTLLLERNGHKTSRTAYIVYYFPVGGVLHEGFPFDALVHTIKTDPDAIYKLFVEACRCLDKDIPGAGFECEYCRWIDARAVGDEKVTRSASAGKPRKSKASAEISDDLFA